MGCRGPSVDDIAREREHYADMMHRVGNKIISALHQAGAAELLSLLDEEGKRWHDMHKWMREKMVTKEFIDLTTRVMCGLLQKITEIRGSEFVDAILDEESASWWEEHQRLDAQRRAEEEALQERVAAERRRQELVRSAKAKLTPEEFEAVLVEGKNRF